MNINLEAVTVQDYINMDELKGAGVLLDNGKVTEFKYDRDTKTRRPHVDGDRE